MFCEKCGKEINDEAVVCIHCGCKVRGREGALNNEVSKNPDHDLPKTGIGVLLGLFLGIIGLIIGICIYPEGTVARKTFIKAWAITYGCEVLLSIIFTVVVTIYLGFLGALL